METVLDLVRSFGINPGRPVGRKHEHHCACPGCGGNDRLRIWPEQNDGGLYDCRGCGKRGDNIQFCRDFLGLDFKAAAERCGREDLLDNLTGKKPKPRQAKSARLPQEKPAADYIPASHNFPPEAWVTQANEFAHQCHLALITNKKLMDWLAGRGLTAKAVARYSLGWNFGDGGKALYKSRKTWGLPLVANEVGRSKPLWLPIGLVIPYLVDNQVVRLRIRRPKAEREQSLPDLKYYVVPGSFMGTMVLEPHRRAFAVIEAELDAMASAVATELCGAVAVLTLEGKPDNYAHQILSNSLQILEALDIGDHSDGARAAGKRARKWWRITYPDICERWPVPRGKDPGEAAHAGVDLGEWITAGLPPVLTVTGATPVNKPPVEAVNEGPGYSAVSSGLQKGDGKQPEALPSPLTGDEVAVLQVNDRTINVVGNRKTWQQLVDSGELTFSVRELERLRVACRACGDHGPELAAAVLKIKDVFPGAYVREGRKCPA